MIWGQGAYTWMNAAHTGVAWNPNTPLDDQNPQVLSIGANVTLINSAINAQSANAAYVAMAAADAAQAVLPSPATDRAVNQVLAAASSIDSKAPDAGLRIADAQSALADMASIHPELANQAADAIRALDQANKTIHDVGQVKAVSVSATPPTNTNPMQTSSGSPLLAAPAGNTQPAVITQPIVQHQLSDPRLVRLYLLTAPGRIDTGLADGTDPQQFIGASALGDLQAYAAQLGETLLQVRSAQEAQDIVSGKIPLPSPAAIQQAGGAMGNSSNLVKLGLAGLALYLLGRRG